MKNILVTGGSGFIGSNIVLRLLENKSYNISVLDNQSRGSIKRLKNVINKIKYINGDIRDLKVLSTATQNIDTIFHLAYVNGTRFFYEKPDLIMDVAVRGMINLNDICLKNKVKNFILFSSSETYSNPNIIPTPEDIPLVVPDINNPRYSYGGGKICCELILKFIYQKFYEKSLIIRPHNVYGPDMGNEHFFPEIIKKIKKIGQNKKSLSIQGSGAETRSFIYIEDFLDALMLVLKKEKKNNIYNIGTSEQIKILKAVKLVQKICNNDSKIIFEKLRQGSPLKRCPDISKIRKLGFKQKIKLKDGLKKICNWYLKNEQ